MDLYPLSVEGLPEEVKIWFDIALRNIALRAVKDYLKISTIYHKTQKILIEWYPSRNEGLLSYRGKVIGMYRLSQGELYQISYDPLGLSDKDERSSYTELYTVGGLEADIMADSVPDVKFAGTNYPDCSPRVPGISTSCSNTSGAVKSITECRLVKDSGGGLYVIPFDRVGGFNTMDRPELLSTVRAEYRSYFIGTTACTHFAVRLYTELK